MPNYDYDCASCNQTFEVFQSMSAAPLEQCPNCGGKVQRRIHGGSGLIFKGSGFYLTDYKKNAAPSDGKTEKSDDAAKPASDKAAAEKKSGETPKPTTTSTPST